MTKKEKIIYLAGIMDGEGTFYRPAMKKKDRKRTYYYPRMVITQKERPLLDWTKKNFGGCIYQEKVKRH